MGADRPVNAASDDELAAAVDILTLVRDRFVEPLELCQQAIDIAQRARTTQYEAEALQRRAEAEVVRLQGVIQGLNHERETRLVAITKAVTDETTRLREAATKEHAALFGRLGI